MTDWQEQAECRLHPEVDFFPSREESTTEVAKARAVCAACPVRSECLDYAMTPPAEVFGIWGGTSALQRKQMRKRRAGVHSADPPLRPPALPRREFVGPVGPDLGRVEPTAHSEGVGLGDGEATQPPALQLTGVDVHDGSEADEGAGADRGDERLEVEQARPLRQIPRSAGESGDIAARLAPAAGGEPGPGAVHHRLVV